METTFPYALLLKVIGPRLPEEVKELFNTGVLGLTPFKLRLVMLALLGVGIFLGTIGTAYAQDMSIDDVDSKVENLIRSSPLRWSSLCRPDSRSLERD